MLVNSDLEENKDCFFNNTKLEASADVIYNYQYYDIIGIIKYLCGIIVLNSVTYILKKTRKKYCKKTIRNCTIILLPICVYVLYEKILGNLFTVSLGYAVLKIVSRFFRKNKSGHLVAGSQPAMISDSRSSSAFKR